jgi:predicted regulator of Ras-like GTPase activity (Roadblock/LC7/MglB family)
MIINLYRNDVLCNRDASFMEEQLMDILKSTSKKFQFVVVVDKNGLPIMSYNTETNERVDPSMETVVAGIGAAVLSLAESTSSVLEQGNLKELVIKKDQGSIILIDAGQNAILLGILPPDVGYDAPIVSLKIIAGQIRKLQIPSQDAPSKPDDDFDIFIPEID